ncbi:hypothetical protein KGQ24_02460 [Patescibacteria group bacterium]|nr:hypothetical protein [Patescibacteria group bacterium]
MKILIVYTYSGSGGHKKIAENIGAVLHENHQVDMIDLYEKEKGSLVSGGTKIYYWIIKFVPGLWTFFYTNKIFLAVTLPLRVPLAGLRSKKLLNIINAGHYDLVISTHTSSSAAVSYLKSKGLYNGKFAIAFSDFHFHPYWAYDHCDMYLANIDEQKQQLVARGIGPEKIAVCGITVQRKQNLDIGEIRNKYGLKSGEKVVLFLSGSAGAGLNSETISQLLATDAKIIIACGSNREFLQAVHDEYGDNPRIIPVGYVPWYELYPLADIVVTKPGGLTVTECLEHGLPMLISYLLPGQEELNYEYLSDKDLIMPEFADLAGAIQDELQTKSFAESLKHNPYVPQVVKYGREVIEAISRLS